MSNVLPTEKSITKCVKLDKSIITIYTVQEVRQETTKITNIRHSLLSPVGIDASTSQYWYHPF